MTLAEARRIVRKAHPEAFGWREFTVSDYVVKDHPGGKVLARGAVATHVWVEAAAAILNRPTPFGDRK